MTHYMYRDQNHQWRWHLDAGNGRKIANSGEAYQNKQDCSNAIALVKGSASTPVREI